MANPTIETERALDTRPPAPVVVLCDSCGKPVNLMTSECPGCSD